MDLRPGIFSPEEKVTNRNLNKTQNLRTLLALVAVSFCLVLFTSVSAQIRPVVIASDSDWEVSGPGGSGHASLVTFSGWPGIDGASWIWSSSSVSQSEAMYGSDVVTFRRKFNIPAASKSLQASVQIDADNAYKLTLNGELIGSSGPLDRSSDQDQLWNKIDTYSVKLRPGANEIVIEAINYKYPGDPNDASPDKNPAGVIFLLKQFSDVEISSLTISNQRDDDASKSEISQLKATIDRLTQEQNAIYQNVGVAMDEVKKAGKNVDEATVKQKVVQAVFDSAKRTLSKWVDLDRIDYLTAAKADAGKKLNDFKAGHPGANWDDPLGDEQENPNYHTYQTYRSLKANLEDLTSELNKELAKKSAYVSEANYLDRLKKSVDDATKLLNDRTLSSQNVQRRLEKLRDSLEAKLQELIDGYGKLEGISDPVRNVRVVDETGATVIAAVPRRSEVTAVHENPGAKAESDRLQIISALASREKLADLLLALHLYKLAMKNTKDAKDAALEDFVKEEHVSMEMLKGLQSQTWKYFREKSTLDVTVTVGKLAWATYRGGEGGFWVEAGEIEIELLINLLSNKDSYGADTAAIQKEVEELEKSLKRRCDENNDDDVAGIKNKVIEELRKDINKSASENAKRSLKELVADIPKEQSSQLMAQVLVVGAMDLPETTRVARSAVLQSEYVKGLVHRYKEFFQESLKERFSLKEQGFKMAVTLGATVVSKRLEEEDASLWREYFVHEIIAKAAFTAWQLAAEKYYQDSEAYENTQKQLIQQYKELTSGYADYEKTGLPVQTSEGSVLNIDVTSAVSGRNTDVWFVDDQDTKIFAQSIPSKDPDCKDPADQYRFVIPKGVKSLRMFVGKK